MMLGEFLRDAASNRTPGNCSTLPADWCMALGHPDYAEPWRGLTEEREIEAACVDGLLPLWQGALDDHLPLASEPYEPGDIAVIALFGAEAGAIFTGERWALRRTRGLVCVPMPRAAISRAWRPAERR